MRRLKLPSANSRKGSKGVRTVVKSGILLPIDFESRIV